MPRQNNRNISIVVVYDNIVRSRNDRQLEIDCCFGVVFRHWTQCAHERIILLLVTHSNNKKLTRTRLTRFASIHRLTVRKAEISVSLTDFSVFIRSKLFAFDYILDEFWQKQSWLTIVVARGNLSLIEGTRLKQWNPLN